MDAKPIDQLSRMLATRARRRPVLAALLAGFGLRILGGEVQPAAAKCNKVGHRCERKKDCCDHADCKSKKCRCKKGYKNCDNKCFDLDREEKHCGNCATRCGTAETCCNGVCADLARSAEHCGACGRICATGTTCVGGQCVDDVCRAGQDVCDLNIVPCGTAGNSCFCYQSTEGTTFCAASETAFPPICGDCETSTDCAHLGPTAVCVDSRPGCCSAGELGFNFCRLPCPSPA